LSEAERILLIEISGNATAEHAMNLLDLAASCSEANAALAIQILETLPIRKLASKIPEQVLRALVPYREHNPPLPQAVVRSVLMQLTDVPDLDQLGMFSESQEWGEIVAKHTRLVFDLMLARVDRATDNDAPANYQPIPLSFDRRLNLPDLAKEPDYADICRNLWECALKSNSPQQIYWVRLFQAVAMDDSSIWLDRMQQEIESAMSEESLSLLVRLLKFDGSLIIFRFPELTKSFLRKAKKLGGQQLYDTISAGLYAGCGPQIRTFTNGKLDEKLDYVESEAAKAAEIHAADEWLGPFYRWIVEIEHKNRLMNKMRSEAEMADLD
jgi:hypothetical protein